MSIQMVDLKGQYQKIKPEIDTALLSCAESANYIKGNEVKQFEDGLAKYLNTDHVISCGNGTDALQIALMALDLKPEDEVIVPAFTYVATAEAIALLKLKPVMVDVDSDTFNISIDSLEKAITPKTKAIVPVHLYGQSADMESIMMLADKYGIFVIEDNAQSLGAEYIFSNGTKKKTGTIGHIGCYSFFPTKNLGCFGDGGALSTNDSELAKRCQMIASHGQQKKYYHETIGCNSRLDTIQAGILNVKLKYLDEYIFARKKSAEYYFQNLDGLEGLVLPNKAAYANHTFNQFTLKVQNNNRDKLQAFLKEQGIPSIIYYPFPLYAQPAFKQFSPNGFQLENTEILCKSVLSIPMHTELTEEIQDKVIESIRNFN
ncbi:DegT/DnrJ/EryC1/StrS aminotransferase family protein [Prolixibacter sp. SD074]|uniref:DegT/DnrJ/EryC1/StrS family aminotransferase n=1 Tax=Prolixibacter sp. SD074 TaxID=2652391 RepID=UPI00127C623D|nr:DegT/DnrJ/EryC1/StrS family aminotransferase [Prolixibacter sp. SD074]GET29332.1 cell surface polysaccharide biosynthesis protein [Prolixibacter sp. SD074]